MRLTALGLTETSGRLRLASEGLTWAAGLSLPEAVSLLRRMAGPFRLPEALRRVDALSRGAPPRVPPRA